MIIQELFKTEPQHQPTLPSTIPPSACLLAQMILVDDGASDEWMQLSDLIQLIFKLPPPSYYKIRMQGIKDKQKCPPGCDEHNLELRNLHFNNKIDATISFCPKMQRGSLPSQKTIPEFNRDKKYYTSAFVLGTQLKNLTIRNQQMQMDFQRQIKDAQEKNNQITFPRPNENNNYCSICKARYTNYFYHIRDQDHQERIKASIFNSEMSKLCRKFQCLWDGCQQRADKVALEEYLSFKTKIEEEGDSSLNESDLDGQSENEESESSHISDEHSFSDSNEEDHSMKDQNEDKSQHIDSEQPEDSVEELSSKQLEFLLEGNDDQNESSEKPNQSESIKGQRENLNEHKSSSEEDNQSAKSQSPIHQSKESEKPVKKETKKPKQRKKHNETRMIRKKMGNSKRIQVMLKKVGSRYEVIRDKKKRRQDQGKKTTHPRLPTHQMNSSRTNRKDNHDERSMVPETIIHKSVQPKVTRQNHVAPPPIPHPIKNSPYHSYPHVDPMYMPMYMPMHPHMSPYYGGYMNPSYRKPGEK